MEHYPTAEEEFELYYGDEMELLEQAAEENNPSESLATEQPPRPQTSMSTISSILNSETARTPHRFPASRICSTPFVGINENYSYNDNSNGKRKRYLTDLFGEIDDISEVDFETMPKRIKSIDEIELELIEKILDARAMQKKYLNPLIKSDAEKLKALHAYKIQNLSITVPKWPFLTVRRTDKDRVYVRFHSEEFEDEQLKEIGLNNREFESLFGASKSYIWKTAQDLVLKNSSTQNSQTIQINNEITEIPKTTEASLWVEKYKPKRYMDLLSDETTNRCLLQWLKMWDKVVFGKETIKPVENTTTLNTFNKKKGRFEKGGWRKYHKTPLNTNYDEIGRPVQKVALLCGPPGLGKTTLAHTIAKHAGYVILEMNASDDRSVDAFRLTLENGTQMKSVLYKNKRPNCIILDEIDGAPQASIDFLIKFVQDNVVERGKKKDEKTNKQQLKRPIICICNDMYVPALRQLRQIALVVNFPPIENARLAERLCVIANKEKIRTDMSALLSMAQKTGNDVRSCISMLQFYSGIKKPLTLIDVLKSNIGQKDRHKSLFGVWSAIFQIQRPTNKLSQVTENTDTQVDHVVLSDVSPKSRMDHVLEVVHMGGDYERLMQGVYENYLYQKMANSNMTDAVDALDWFCFSDRVQKIINQQQNYAVYPYLQYGFVAWHFLFAGLAWPKINFPSKGIEVHQKATTSRMIVAELRRGIKPSCSSIGESGSTLLDTMPFIKRIVCPALRSVSTQLLTSREKSDLKHTVEVMTDLGISYSQIKTVDGTYQYTIEPNLDILSYFTGLSVPELSYWTKQLIAREVELEKVRRATPQSFNVKPNTFKQPKTVQTKTNIPNHLQILQAKTVTTIAKEVISKDFFGRIVTKSAPTPSQEVAANLNSIIKSPIWYRYKEGFNNAVRKDLTISDFQ